MVKSKTKIETQLKKKTNTELVKTIINAKKNKAWLKVAEIISSSRRNRIDMNLEEIDKKTKEGEKIIIPGKVLSQGELTKKLKITALNFSEKAKEKILKAKCELNYISEEVKSNPDAKGIKILK
jgi:large subunit ribosomal protein L18e